MRVFVACFFVFLFDVLRVCQALKCTPLTDNTCTKSLYVTGQCKSGECECVDGMVPDDYGCHEPFKPNLSVTFPEKWSGEIRSDGSISIQCSPSTYDPGNYKWYRNGKEIETEKDQDIVVRNLQANDVVDIRCLIKAYGVETEKSDPLVLKIGKEDQPFTKKPVVVGMPNSAALDSTIRLTCNNIPATQNSYIWQINGETLPNAHTRSISLDMSANRFDKRVICIVSHENSSLNIASDPFSTPTFPAADIPGVIIKGNNHYVIRDTLHLVCEISEDFSMSLKDVIIYAWKGPGGEQIHDVTSKEFVKTMVTKDDAGTYTCMASYNNNSVKKSPNFIVTVDDQLSTQPVIEVKPKKPVVGGYVSVVCKLPGYDPSSVQYTWQSMTAKQQIYTLPHLRDNILQMNNVKKSVVQKVFMCKTNSGMTSALTFIPEPVPMTKDIKPSVVEVNDTDAAYSYVLACDSDYESPGIVFEWYVDDVKQADQTRKKFSINAKATPRNVQCRMSFNASLSSLSDIFSTPVDVVSSHSDNFIGTFVLLILVTLLARPLYDQIELFYLLYINADYYD